LHKIQSRDKNIITVEDPVEYKSDTINQIQVNSSVGLTFSSGLRSILRQDPDIIMVGEIRDNETASIAVQSALTGHMVFSTLHTNTAPSAITRLLDMGVERFLISSALLGVLAQRLVRVVCDDCKEYEVISSYYAKELNIKENVKICKEVGCKSCNFTGYSKRVAIAELFVMEDNVQMALKQNVDDTILNNLASENGMVSIKKQLISMVQNGTTTLSEAIRVGLK
jgi:general secretion pathway protein E